MKVLFVCEGNVGRSQAAMEFYNQKFPGQAESAGTTVDKPGQKIGDIPEAASILGAMNEHGLNMNENSRTQLTKDHVEKFDKIIIMADPATFPDFLVDNKKIEYWDIENAKSATPDKALRIRDQIKAKVDDLIVRTNKKA